MGEGALMLIVMVGGMMLVSAFFCGTSGCTDRLGGQIIKEKRRKSKAGKSRTRHAV